MSSPLSSIFLEIFENHGLAHGANSVLNFLTITPDDGVLKRDTTRRTEVPAMDFSLIDSLDENACYAKLVELLHPDGLVCPSAESATLCKN